MLFLLHFSLVLPDRRVSPTEDLPPGILRNGSPPHTTARGNRKRIRYLPGMPQDHFFFRQEEQRP